MTPGKPQVERVVLASGNAGKLAELQKTLAPLGITLLSQADFGVPEVAETGLTFVENALLKARAASRHSGLPAIADDSGLEVDHLAGAPGIHSARYAEGGGDRANNDKLLQALAGVPDDQRGARFQCLLVFLRHWQDPTPLICQGTWEGSILSAPRGTGGFGYYPLFWVPGRGCSSAELPAAEKNRISHRARASQCLVEALRPG
jgi:XTP/dITP diphosphohydrolase